jgi:hypothetical protein
MLGWCTHVVLGLVLLRGAWAQDLSVPASWQVRFDGSLPFLGLTLFYSTYRVKLRVLLENSESPWRRTDSTPFDRTLTTQEGPMGRQGRSQVRHAL